MKGQSRIEFRTRKSRISNAETVNVKNLEDNQRTKAFRPAEHIIHKAQKIEKPIVRKSSRLASKDLKQTVLNLKSNETTTAKESKIKRKVETTASKQKNKKQKQHHDVESAKEIETKQKTTTVEVAVEEETIKVVENPSTSLERNDAAAEDAKNVTVQVETEITTEEINIVTNTTSQESTTSSDISSSARETVAQSEKEESCAANETHAPEDDALSYQDTLSPPSSFIEPMTPPRQTYIAPYKEYLTQTDKQRIEYEKSTLEKLRKSLDIVITDRAARHQPTLYHQVESVLRNSTRRTITLSHICQIMYITPQLYTLEAKELRNYGGKASEAYLIQFAKDWTIPLAGKDLQKRADILKDAMTQYFIDHPEPDASIPAKSLPSLQLVVDKKEWLKETKLPPGVRKLLEAHEKAKEAEIEREKPKPKPTGSVKDRMAALRARLAKKNA